MQQDITENDHTLRDYLNVIFRRASLITLTCITTLSAVWIGLLLKTPTYEAKVKMLILAKKQIDSVYYKDITDFRSAEMILTQSEIVKSNPVIERVVRRLRYSELPIDYEKQFCSWLKAIVLDIKYKFSSAKLKSFSQRKKEEIIFRTAIEELKRKIRVEPIEDTDLFTITVTDFSSTNAAKIANAVSRSYCIFDLEQQLAEFQQKYGEKHLSVMQLKDNIGKMEEALSGEPLPNIEAIGPASVKIIEQAAAPVKPKDSQAPLILILAIVMSFILGVVLAFACESLDSTIKAPDDIKANTGIRFLGYIPEKSSLSAWSILFLERILRIFLITLCLLISLGMLTDWAGSEVNNPIIKFIDKSTYLIFLIKKVIPFNQKISPTLYAIVVIFAIILLSTLLSKKLLLLSRRLLKNKLLLKDCSKMTPYLRAYQNISEEIYLAMNKDRAKSVLAISPLPSEGTTNIIHNLAVYLANTARHKVLLVDANFRKPSLHKTFKVNNAKGLMDTLRQDFSLDELAQEISPNLSLITAGQDPVEPINLLECERLKGILKEAQGKFDIIFFDCANLKDFKDAITLASFVEKIILVVSEGKIRKEVLRAALAPLENKKSNFLGAILNKRTFAIPGPIYRRA